MCYRKGRLDIPVLIEWPPVKGIYSLDHFLLFAFIGTKLKIRSISILRWSTLYLKIYNCMKYFCKEINVLFQANLVQKVSSIFLVTVQNNNLQKNLTAQCQMNCNRNFSQCFLLCCERVNKAWQSVIGCGNSSTDYFLY